ncbi:MAG: hypothetical protein SNJ33_05475 [Rikenellaceae bacterium]
MKKIYNMFPIILAIVVTMVGCVGIDEELLIAEQEIQNTGTFRVGASTSNNQAETKVNVDGATITWCEDDVIAIAEVGSDGKFVSFNTYTIDMETLSSDGKYAEFIGAKLEQGKQYIAYNYPGECGLVSDSTCGITDAFECTYDYPNYEEEEIDLVMQSLAFEYNGVDSPEISFVHKSAVLELTIDLESNSTYSGTIKTVEIASSSGEEIFLASVIFDSYGEIISSSMGGDSCVSLINIATDLTLKASSPTTIKIPVTWNNAITEPQGDFIFTISTTDFKESSIIAPVKVLEGGVKYSVALTFDEEKAETVDIEIPDATFKAYLVENFDTNSDGEINSEEALAVKIISVSTDDIESVAGLEAFTNLLGLSLKGTSQWDSSTSQYVGNGKLTTLDVSANTALASLHCSYNQLTTLDLSENTALTYLDCSYNQLTALDVSASTELTTLWCYYNQLTALDLSANTALASLYCSYNQLTTLDLSENTALTSLSCSSNQLAALDLPASTALTTLQCYSNQLTALDISANTALTYMNCIYNDNLYYIDVWEGFDIANYTNFSADSSATYVVIGEEKVEVVNIEIPDAVFKAHLVEYYDTNSDGEINSVEALAVTAIGVSTDNIESVVGLEAFTNLTTLVLSGTRQWDSSTSQYVGNGKLTTLDVSANTALRSLSCSYNQLTALDVSTKTELTHLYCSYNQITALDLSASTELTALWCFENQLTALDLPASTTLTTLYCQYNQITTLDVSAKTALAALDCSYNQITTALDLSASTALNTLYCQYNQITALDLPATTTLTELWCFENQLTTLDVSAYTALAALFCSYNQLTALDISVNTALTMLSCSGNQLTALDVSANTALTYFHCGGNQLTTLDVSANTALTELRCNVNQLTALDISANTALSIFYCTGNQLTALDVSANTALNTFICPENELTTLDLSANTALTYLTCNSNQLTTLTLPASTALTYILCSYNQLTALDISANTALHTLYCEKNEFTSLDLSANTALTTLWCFYNNITTIYIYEGCDTSGFAKDSTASYVVK